MCCCNDSAPKIFFEDEDGQDVGVPLYETKEFNVLSVKASQGWDGEICLTLIVREKDDGS